MGAVVTLGAYMAIPRGIRNKNPGNIRYNQANQWDGQTGKDSAGFAKFNSSKMGIRALAKLVRNYQRVNGLNTIADIISKYAPATENNTASYIEHVAYAMSYSPASELDLSNPDELADLTKAIIKHENGVNPYSDEEVKHAVALALA